MPCIRIFVEAFAVKRNRRCYLERAPCHTPRSEAAAEEFLKATLAMTKRVQARGSAWKHALQVQGMYDDDGASREAF
jgi:hypothetical protein